jgi:hypothetical protein
MREQNDLPIQYSTWGPRRLWLVLILGPILFMAATLFVPECWRIAKERWNRIPFDSAVWKESLSPSSYWRKPIRQRMVDDLLQRDLLSRKSRDEVIELLGNPPKGPSFNERDLIYLLGPERSWRNLDREWLVIRFDAQEQVYEFQVVTD